MRNVIFDLGGVVLDWNPQRVLSRFAPLEEAGPLKDAVFGHADWQHFDRGTVNEHELLARLGRRIDRPPHELSALVAAARESLVEKPDTVALLRSLQRQGTPLYCLSNMPSSFYVDLKTRHSFWDAFTGIVISGEIQLLKPEPEVYRHLLERFDLRAEESVFIDDLVANVEGARAVGLHGIVFQDAAQCGRELQGLLATAA